MITQALLFPEAIDSPAPVLRLVEAKAKASDDVEALFLEARIAATKVLASRPVITGGAAASKYLTHIIGHSEVEQFAVLCLTQKNAVISHAVVATGTLTECLVHPREVFRPAILANAASVIIAHNHPSGNPSPSPADKSLTLRLKAAADIIGIRLLDHVIVTGSGEYRSFVDEGLL